MKKIILSGILFIGLTNMSFGTTKHGANISSSCNNGGIATFRVEKGALVNAYFTGTYIKNNYRRKGKMGGQVFHCNNIAGCTFTHKLSLSMKANSNNFELEKHFIIVKGKNEKIIRHSARCR